MLEANVEPLPIFGPPAPGDRICYKISCPRPFPPEQEVTDQFGTRAVKRLRPFLLCTPALKGPAPQASTDTTFPTCAGPCPDPLVCLPKLDGTDDCDCLPQECAADPLTGLCGGSCPISTDVCITLADGSCDCVTQLQCADTFPQCNGACPAFAPVCVESITGVCLCDGCFCQSSGLSCDTGCFDCVCL